MSLNACLHLYKGWRTVKTPGRNLLSYLPIKLSVYPQIPPCISIPLLFAHSQSLSCVSVIGYATETDTVVTLIFLYPVFININK